MSISDKIKKENIIRIIEKFQDELKCRNLAKNDKRYKFALEYKDEYYCPKEVIRKAAKIVGEKDLNFNGGYGNGNIKNSANAFLENLGFKIISLGDKMNKEKLKELIKKFIEESINKNTFKTQNYNCNYKGLEIKVSFGKGSQAIISWMAFLGFNQKVSEGIYPVILFDRENCLILAFGISETNDTKLNWPKEINKKYKKIENANCDKCDISKIKLKYPSSYLKKCFEVENKLTEEQLNDLIENLDEVINIYINIFENTNEEKKCQTCLSNSNLKLENYIINSFYNSLKTKGFVILAGISGSGKTKIFEEFVQCFNTDAKNNLFFPIRPDFKDTKSLLGFYNPLKNNYHSTPLLNFILEASKNYLEKGNESDPFFILFDEMNLARVEYYFADFLSILEAKRFEDKNEILKNDSFQEFLTCLSKDLSENNYKFTSQSIKLHNENITDIPKELFLPPNIYFIGTVNIDETTHMFSPKVLDRAFTIEFDVNNFNDYFNFLENNANNYSVENCDFKKDFINNGNFINIDKNKIKDFLDNNKIYLEKLEEINKILRKYNLHFGYRVFDEIIMFLYNSQYSSFKFNNLDEAFDLAIKMKILPKFHGTRQKLWNPIIELLKILEMEIVESSVSVEDSDKNKENIYLTIEKIKNIPNIDILKLEIELDNNSKIKINTNYKYSIHKLLEMLYKLKSQGFASFI